MFKRYLLALTVAGLLYAMPSTFAQNTSQDTSSTDQQSAPAGAQQGRGYGGRHFDPSRRAGMMAKHLNLNADQKSKVQDILTSEQSQMEKLRGDSSLSQQDRRSRMMEIHKTSNDHIRALLNSDQQQKWDQMQQRREQRMKERHGENTVGNAPQSEQQPQ
jgi:Spy/CpxP family protein refolding chaperone